MQFDTNQLAAVHEATTQAFSIITGGAGTGKTTIIKEVARQLEANGEKVALCAFAGKAAARIREACEHPASTIHRLLGYNGKAYMAEDFTELSIVVDESSMVDSVIMAEIMRRKPKRLCLVGDPAQLPPVGRGQPFHDLIDLRGDTVSTLHTCYRATEAVFRAATAIRSGERPPMNARSENERWSMVNTGNPERTQRQILEWIEGGAIDFSQDIILVARNGKAPADHCTVAGLNAAIVDLISPRLDSDQRFNVGDRVINTKNIPDLDVWNGSTGSIHAIDIDGGIWVKSDTPVIDHSRTKDERYPVYKDLVLFAKDTRKHLQLAYALTVHKAQGSQYRNVLMACFDRDTFRLLDRSLLYTGVTRTREACCVCGQLSSAWVAIDKVNHKNTIIQQIASAAA